MATEDKYEGEMTYLAQYVVDDWLGFSVIGGSVSTILGAGATAEHRLELTMRIAADLLQQGAQAGELTASGFEPWPLSIEESLSEISRRLHDLDGPADSGDVCWFTVD